MAISLWKITLLGVVPFFATTNAFDDIVVPYTITANTNFKVSIENDIGTARSFDARFTHYRVYLATTPPGWGTGPACVLANDTKIDVETLTLQIPASVGPRGTYRLATQEYSEDPRKGGTSGFAYSNNFELKDGTGEWGTSELAGHGIDDADTIPCTAYACVRTCNDDNYMDLTSEEDSKKVFAAYKKTYKCLTACPGVTAPAWNTWYSEDLDDFPKDMDQGESKSATRSSTATSPLTKSVEPSLTSTFLASTSRTPAAEVASSSTVAPSMTRASSNTSAVPTSTLTGSGNRVSLPVLAVLSGSISCLVVLTL